MKDMLTREDLNILNLRHLYEQFGYVHYKMKKFEEYDLYVANKDFLASDNIITFTDNDCMVLALKPDVILSINKNYQNLSDGVERVYYNENIYRTAKSTKTYREIMQMGLECIGDLDIYNICEVLVLAARSLAALSDNYILDLSHMGIIRGLLEDLTLDPKYESELVTLLREKNCHGIRSLGNELDLPSEQVEAIIALASAYGSMDQVLSTIKAISVNTTMKEAVTQLECICKLLTAQGFSNIHLDFSIVNDMSYYNGVMFRGYIDGIPSGVLSGGQYDELTEKMGKQAGAIGFAINMDMINSYDVTTEDYDTDILLLYEATQDPLQLIEAVSKLTDCGYKVQAQRRMPEKLKYKKLMKLTDGGAVEIESDH